MKILVIQTRPGIGDMCIFLPLIHEISKHEKQQVTILAKQRSCCDELVKYDPHIKEVIYYPNSLDINFVKYLRSKNFEKCFIFHYGFRYYLLSKLSKIKKTFFYGFFKKNKSITEEAKNKAKIWMNKKNLDTNCQIFLKEKKIKENNIIIGIGGSGPTKKWNLENYARLIKKIKKNFPLINIIIAGGKNEKQDFEFIKSKLTNIAMLSLCDFQISECIKYLTKSKIYVGNDTGFMHLSGMLGLKSFGLFGDTPTNYCDYNNLLKPIMPKNYKNITHNSKAMDKIDPDWVFEKIYQDIKILIN
jgi:heptosyltransferase-2